MQKEHQTPAAILIGSVIIGAGLYFGLQRSDAPPAPAGPAAAAPSAPAAAPAGQAPAQPAALGAPGAAGGLAPPPVAAELRARVQRDAKEALEARRAEIVKQCWAPSVKKAPEPKQAKYIFDMSFDPTGKQVARGISEVRGMERQDTAQCLRALPMDLKVPPPGTHVGVQVEMILP